MQELDDFMVMVSENRFADAHEVLEHPWKAMKSVSKDESNILKGLINGTTAFELKRRAREDAAARIWGTFEKYRLLIDTVDSVHTDKYRACAAMLEEKYAEVF